MAVEESSLVGWIAGALRPYVTEVIVCDPRHNALISRRGNKDDYTDAVKLCRLLRLGELTPVYHPDHEHRADFKIAVQQYLAFRCDHATLKRQIKAKYHQTGLEPQSSAKRTAGVISVSCRRRPGSRLLRACTSVWTRLASYGKRPAPPWLSWGDAIRKSPSFSVCPASALWGRMCSVHSSRPRTGLPRSRSPGGTANSGSLNAAVRASRWPTNALIVRDRGIENPELSVLAFFFANGTTE